MSRLYDGGIRSKVAHNAQGAVCFSELGARILPQLDVIHGGKEVDDIMLLSTDLLTDSRWTDSSQCFKGKTLVYSIPYFSSCHILMVTMLEDCTR